MKLPGPYTHWFQPHRPPGSVNYTRTGERRIELSAGISYVDDLEKAQEVAAQAIGQLPFIRAGKPIQVYFRSFTADSIQFYIWFWIDPQKADPGLATSEAMKALKKAFDQNNILLVFAPYTLDLKERVQPTTATPATKQEEPVNH